MPRAYARTASLVVALIGTFCNFAIAVQLISLWRTFKWEFESDWESEGSGSSWLWGVGGVKLAWGLLSAYFVAAAVASAVGFIGIVKHRSGLVRFYRDYSIADFSFITFFIMFAAYECFRPHVRAGVCEELSRQPELLVDITEMGLNLENCELWFERASIALLGILGVGLIVRLHFLVAVLSYHCQLARHNGDLPIYTSMRTISPPSAQRIYLLPSPTETSFSTSQYTAPEALRENSDNDAAYVVYAPVPMSILSEQQAREMKVTEAWLSRSPDSPVSPQGRGHSHSRSHSYRHRHHNSTGRISLAVVPDEALLPGYEEPRLKELKA